MCCGMSHVPSDTSSSPSLFDFSQKGALSTIEDCETSSVRSRPGNTAFDQIPLVVCVCEKRRSIEDVSTDKNVEALAL